MKSLIKLGTYFILIMALTGCTTGGRYVPKSNEIESIVIKQPDQINGKIIDGTRSIEKIVRVVDHLKIGGSATEQDSSSKWYYNILLLHKEKGTETNIWLTKDKIIINGMWYEGSKENIETLESLYDSLNYLEQRIY
jgi:hypothetical protein